MSLQAYGREPLQEGAAERKDLKNAQSGDDDQGVNRDLKRAEMILTGSANERQRSDDEGEQFNLEVSAGQDRAVRKRSDGYEDEQQGEGGRRQGCEQRNPGSGLLC